jgi:hypothetical protein
MRTRWSRAAVLALATLALGLAIGSTETAALASTTTARTIVIGDNGGDGPGPKEIVITDPPGPGQGPKAIVISDPPGPGQGPKAH